VVVGGKYQPDNGSTPTTTATPASQPNPQGASGNRSVEMVPSSRTVIKSWTGFENIPLEEVKDERTEEKMKKNEEENMAYYVSHTALVVCSHRAQEAKRNDALFIDPTAEIMLNEVSLHIYLDFIFQLLEYTL